MDGLLALQHHHWRPSAASRLRANGRPAPAYRESRLAEAGTFACLFRVLLSSELDSTPDRLRNAPTPVTARHRVSLPPSAGPKPAQCDNPRDHPPEIPDES